MYVFSVSLLICDHLFCKMKQVHLGDKLIGDGNPCYIVAEIGGLFKDIDEAKKLLNSAKEIGVDAVKFQSLEADTITTKKNLFDMEVTGDISQYDFFKQFEPSKELQKQVVEYANKIDIQIFSAPSHMKDLEIMKEMKLPIFKIGSDLACHIPLLIEVAKLNKPIILSTGMCTMDEVRDSVNAILSTGNEKLVLLHCVSDYPAKAEESNLKAILEMKKEFNLPVGFSDHTIGTDITFASVVMGANVVERHFRDVTNNPAPDDVHALTKEEFLQLINSIRTFEKAKGTGKKDPTPSEQHNLSSNRVSIIVMKDIPKGSVLTKEMLDIRRPGIGLSPKHYDEILGKKTSQDISSETPLTWNLIE